MHRICMERRRLLETNCSMTAEEIIDRFNLERLPYEGGYFKEVYQDTENRSQSSIYYLITGHEFSALHRLKVVEILHFYAGDVIETIQIDPDGKLSRSRLSTIDQGREPQLVIPRNHWQGTRLLEGGQWALIGSTCGPAFEWDGFELGERETLIARYPEHREMIMRYSRETEQMEP